MSISGPKFTKLTVPLGLHAGAARHFARCSVSSSASSKGAIVSHMGPVLPNVSSAANWAVVPVSGARETTPGNWSCRGSALKSNVVTRGDALPCG